MKNKTYGISKIFLAGPLKGMQVTEKTTVKMEVDKTYKECAGSGKYVIVSCVELN